MLILVVVAALPVARAAAAAPPAGEPAKSALTAAAVLAASSAADWRPLDAQHTLYLELPAGRVVIELAPRFAPSHVANVEALVRAKFFDGLSVVRVQDNYVVQWGDADARKPLGTGRRTLAAEFERPLRGLAVTRLPDADTYAPQVGFVDGFPVAVDPGLGRAWLVHCYGMVGAGRDSDVDSGGGAELYAVIGQAPRHLDRNVTLLGRVVAGMELLAALPRGSGPLGRYEHPEQHVPIRAVSVAADVPAAQRSELEVLRTDTSDLPRLRRGAPQPPRGLVQGAGRARGRVQRADPGAAAQCGGALGSVVRSGATPDAGPRRAAAASAAARARAGSSAGAARGVALRHCSRSICRRAGGNC